MAPVCALVLAACAGSAQAPTGDATPARAATPGGEARCAGGSQAFFSDLQSAAHWTAYCPTWLPSGMHFSPRSPDDRTEARWLDEAGHAIELIQGPGESLYLVRDGTGGFASPTGSAAFGDLTAQVYGNESSLVVLDGNEIGHRLMGSEVALDDLLHVARSMEPVSAEVAMLLNADETDGLVFRERDLTADSFGHDLANPSACGKQPDSGATLSAVSRVFEVPPPGDEPDWEMPQTYETLVRFASADEAARYLRRWQDILTACEALYDSEQAGDDFQVESVSDRGPHPVADELLNFREITRSEVQSGQVDAVLLRVGDRVAIILREQTLPAGARPVPGDIFITAFAATHRLPPSSGAH